MKHKGTKIAEHFLEKNKAELISKSNFKTY